MEQHGGRGANSRPTFKPFASCWNTQRPRQTLQPWELFQGFDLFFIFVRTPSMRDIWVLNVTFFRALA